MVDCRVSPTFLSPTIHLPSLLRSRLHSIPNLKEHLTEHPPTELNRLQPTDPTLTQPYPRLESAPTQQQSIHEANLFLKPAENFLKMPFVIFMKRKL
jgi:hypothetical protein